MKIKHCLICGSKHTKIYAKCCSKACSNILRKRTCLEVYGVEASSQNPEVKKKFQETCEKLYGGHPSKNDEVKTKIKSSNLERYGHENVAQSPEVKAKIKATNLETYGGHPLQNEEVRTKMKTTNRDRYGVDWVLRSAAIQEKVKKSNIEKFGTSNPAILPEIQTKMKLTSLERYGRDNIKQISIKNYENYNKEYVLENFTTNGEVTLSQRSEICEYYGISNENNVLRKLKEWGIPTEITLNSFSFAEKQLLSRLQEKYPLFTFIENDRSIIKNQNTARYLEIDIVIKNDKGDIICGIEYNGVYWHDKENQEREKLKSQLCLEKGFPLFHVWEDTKEIDVLEIEEFLSFF